MLTLAQLRETITRSGALASALSTLQSLGFDTTSWNEVSWQRAMVEFFSDRDAALTENVSTLSKIAFNDTSFGDSLTAFADSHYDNQRASAVRARHQVRLTAATGAGPFTIAASDLTAKESETGEGLLFTNEDGGTLSSGGTLDLAFEAQVAGVDGNVSVGSIDILVTTLVGVTIANIDTGSGTSLLTSGADGEGDAALQARNRSKWGTLTWATPASGYEYFAREGSSNIARVKVDDGNPRGPGTIDIYVATASGVAGADDVAGAQTQLNTRHSGSPNPLAIASAGTATAFSANVYVASAHFDESGTIADSKATEIESALTAYVNGLPIGGRVLPPPDGDGVNGAIIASEWRGAVTNVDGVEAIGSPVPAPDLTISPYDVATVGSITFTYVQVT